MKKIITALCATALMSSPAFAGWDYANWGMAPKKVIKASKGKTKAVRDEDKHRLKGLPRLALGDADQDGIPLKIAFYFANSGKQLVMLDVVPKDSKNCAALSKNMVGRYGEGKLSESKLNLSEDTPPVDVIERSWTDLPNRNRTTFLIVNMPNNGPTLFCKTLIEDTAYNFGE